MPLALFLLVMLQIAPIPVPLPPLDVGGEIVGPYLFREDAGPTTKVILQNGLTVIVREENAVPLASITTLVKAGYFDEPDALSGVSHLIEHMLFRGNRTRGAGQIARETRGLGGTLDAYTAYDRTVYQVVVPAANLLPAMEIQADALWNPAFDAEDLARETEIVLGENDHRLDDPRAVAEERLYATAFSDHRIRREGLGTPEGLRRLTAGDLADYHARYYQPSNVVLVVVGQFSREDVLAEIVRLYGAVEDTPVERDTWPSEPPQTAVRYGWDRADVAHSQVAMGFHVPGVLSADAYALEVLSAILTNGRASRFNRILRDEEDVLTRATSAYAGFRDMGFFRILLESATPIEAERGALEELERIRRFGVTAEELARAKVLIALDHYRRVESVEGLGDQLAAHEALGDWRRLSEFLPRIREVAAEDVERVVARFFVPSNTSVFEYIPDGAEIAMTVEALERRVTRALPANMVERSVDALPVPAEVPLFDEERIAADLVREPRRLSILRGPDVHVVEDPRLPLVSFGVFFPGGRLYENEENAGITELMLRSALRGTRRYNTAGIARRLENAGARIEVVNEPDFFGYVLEGLTGHIQEALEVLMDVLQEPTFPEDLVAQEQRIQGTRLRQLRDDAIAYPAQLFIETLFEGHPYGRGALGTQTSLAALTRDAVELWHREQQRELMPVIVLIGDTSGSSLVSSITERLTNEDLIERGVGDPDLPEAAALGREAVGESGRRQSALVYGSLGPAFPEPDRLPLAVLEEAMSGPGGRLFDAIRERSGLAYTVRTFADFRARAGAFFMYTAFAPADETRIRSLLESEIRGLIEEGISDEELERAKNATIGLHEAGLQSRRERTLAFARALISGAGTGAVTGYGSLIREVDGEAVHEAARDWLDPASATVVIVRGRE